MARMLNEILTLGLILGLTSIALGQGQAQQRPKDAALGPLLSNPDVQKELKLSEEQVGKLKDALGKVIEKYKDDFAKLQQLSPEEQQKKLMAINEEHKKAVAGTLDAKQWKRYKQIQWQSDPLGSFQDPDLQKELKLSDEQKKKLDGIFTDAGKKMQEMSRSRETTRESFQAFLKDVDKKANEVLSEEQQKNLKELKGPPFQPSRPASPPPSEK